MSKLTFSFDKPYDEVEIHGEVYKLYYDDDSLRKYQEQAFEYKEKVMKYLERQANIPNMSEDERKKLEAEGMKFIERFIESFYGEGAFQRLYEESGKAMINFMPLVEFTLEWLKSKTPEVDEHKREYYVGKKK